MIRIDGGFDQWADVAPDFRDHVGETLPRDHAGVGETHYVNRTGRNDLTQLKVARDDQHVYFLARTREPITPRTDDCWMWLLINADADPSTGWEGFDFVVNRWLVSEGLASLEKHERGWQWKPVASVPYRASGRELQLAVPARRWDCRQARPASCWISNGPTTCSTPTIPWTFV